MISHTPRWWYIPEHVGMGVISARVGNTRKGQTLRFTLRCHFKYAFQTVKIEANAKSWNHLQCYNFPVLMGVLNTQMTRNSTHLFSKLHFLDVVKD